MPSANTRWIICERRPDGSEVYYTEEARGALFKLNAGWGCGRTFKCRESARLALAWLSVVYHIEDTGNRNSESLRLIFDKTLREEVFTAWNVRFAASCTYFVSEIDETNRFYEDVIDPESINLPTFGEELNKTIEKIH